MSWGRPDEDPPPAVLAEGRRAYSARTPGAELAALVYDSLESDPARVWDAVGRVLVFTTGDVSVVMQSQTTGEAAKVELVVLGDDEFTVSLRTSEHVLGTAGPSQRSLGVDGVPPRPISALLVAGSPAPRRRVVTDWVLLA